LRQLRRSYPSAERAHLQLRRFTVALQKRNKRDLAIFLAFRFLGLPYRWGGNDPVDGFDCSGLIVELLKSVGVLGRKGDWSSRGLWSGFQDNVRSHPEAGFLVFYSSKAAPDRITHVEMCLDSELAIGASGGGSKTLTEEDAAHMDAYIKVRPIDRGRPIVGYVDPFAGDADE
jgi:murein DD-endopeptidase